jgi:hypothetical protein
MTNTDLHTITTKTARGHEIPDKTLIGLRLGMFPATVTVEVKLPGQQRPRTYLNLPIKDGVVTLPFKLLFLSYAREDQKAVTDIGNRLYQDGFLTWLDRKDLRPGDLWKTRIKRGMDSADYVLIFLSKASASKTGYVQAEMKYAFEQYKLRPDEQRYIIPILLEDFTPPDRFEDFTWLRWWEDDAYERLKSAFED